MKNIEDIVNSSLEIEHNGSVETLELPHDHFSIDPSELDRELCTIGKLMLHYGELEARLQMEVERKEVEFKAADAVADLELRQAAKETGEKITEGVISARLVSNPTRLEKLKEVAKVRGYYNLARSAHNALRGKRDCLIALAYREKELMKLDRYSS